MRWELDLFPERASTVAGEVDALYLALCLVSGLFAVLIAVLIVVFAIKYRRRSEADLPRPVSGSLGLEITWTVIPLVIALAFFAWGSSLYFTLTEVPRDALEVVVVAKRWMWKFQHLEGRREINELHVPVGRPIRLTMASEDVIHSFFVPAFRIKRDVVPGRTSITWFEATRPGRYRLFCAEYCGARHSGMVGWIVAMAPADWARWLRAEVAGESLAQRGAKIFVQHGCASCHRGGPSQRGPALEGLFGRRVRLEGGGTVLADEQYLRESIESPGARIVAGYSLLMPAYRGLVSQEELLDLIAYLRSLGPAGPGTEAR
ncbi:MAG: cytochrome c oxidase subunit II [Deltaproteobacteria bacterium]|nr:cytochrome c oxidase subunit II [Deltaproteobacteria bacterium]